MPGDDRRVVGWDHLRSNPLRLHLLRHRRGGRSVPGPCARNALCQVEGTRGRGWCVVPGDGRRGARDHHIDRLDRQGPRALRKEVPGDGVLHHDARNLLSDRKRNYCLLPHPGAVRAVGRGAAPAHATPPRARHHRLSWQPSCAQRRARRRPCRPRRVGVPARPLRALRLCDCWRSLCATGVAPAAHGVAEPGTAKPAARGATYGSGGPLRAASRQRPAPAPRASPARPRAGRRRRDDGRRQGDLGGWRGGPYHRARPPPAEPDPPIQGAAGRGAGGRRGRRRREGGGGRGGGGGAADGRAARALAALQSDPGRARSHLLGVRGGLAHGGHVPEDLAGRGVKLQAPGFEGFTYQDRTSNWDRPFKGGRWKPRSKL